MCAFAWAKQTFTYSPFLAPSLTEGDAARVYDDKSGLLYFDPSLPPSLPSLGVYRNTETLKYEAYLDLPLGRLFLGVFETEEEAAHAYDQGGLLYFSFPALNFCPITGKRNSDRLFALHR